MNHYQREKFILLIDVIQALQREKFIPYGNSRLIDWKANTSKENGKTIMFVNLCPALVNSFEKVSWLKFAKGVAEAELVQAKKKVVNKYEEI